MESSNRDSMDSMVPSMSNGLVVSLVSFKPPGFLPSKDPCEAGPAAHRAPLISSGDLMQHVVGQCDSPAPSEEMVGNPWKPD